MSRELQRERDYLAMLYARLDAAVAEATERLESVRLQDTGDHHQSRSERDSFAQLYEDRILQLREVGERLAFGRLDMEDGSRHYIGRIGLRDEEQRSLLLDWRVPQASAFYQATARRPLGARSRRHLISKGRTLVRIEDEVFDADALSDEDLELQGEAALLAAITAERTGRMSDIVATIQAEQDRIIRSELRGTLVVQGGPGTGKTAVALHRAAYLLYSHRERLTGKGVLIVGPSSSFLGYIESVLPSLGETGVVLMSLGRLFPGVEATAEDAPSVTKLKGQVRMAELLRRAVTSRHIVPEAPVRIEALGQRVTIEPSLIRAGIERAEERRLPHNEARVVFVKFVLDRLAKQLLAARKAAGHAEGVGDMPMLREELRSHEGVRIALNTAWLPLTPEKLVRDLYARPHWLQQIAPDWSASDRALLRRDRSAPLTLADVPLLDEAAELLGELAAPARVGEAARKAERRRDRANAEAAIANMGLKGMVDADALAAGFGEGDAGPTLAERAADDRGWVYGHVVVDEAQELSPMHWRMLLRRCPSRSFTVVGDIAQSAAAGAAPSWAEALGELVGQETAGDRWRLEQLTVNYRTPRQIAELAESMALAHELPITRARAVRESRWPIEVFDDAVAAVEAAKGTGGTHAVIVLPEQLDAVYERLRERLGDQVGRGETSLIREIAVLSPRESKGLEFDTVTVIDPGAMVAASERGASALYVALTRATQRLHLVARSTLPAGMDAVAARSSRSAA